MLILALFWGCKSTKTSTENTTASDATSGATKKVNVLHYPQEKHLKNIRQLTFGGDNAEAYWSFDSKKLTYQSINKAWGLECEQIFTMDANDAMTDGKMTQLVSTGNGKTTST